MAAPELPPKIECTNCGEAKPHTLEYFSPMPSIRGGSLRRKCKTCNARQTAEWRKNNPAKAAASKSKANSRARWSPAIERVYPHRRCSKCGEAKPNNPDHFGRGGKRDGLTSRCLACHRQSHHENKASRNATKRAYYARLAEENPEQLRQWRQQWREKNRERYNSLIKAGKHRRRAKLKDVSGSFDADDIGRLLAAQKNTCWWCSKKLTKYHVDHRIPIAKGGTNGLENIVISCPHCNQSRSAKFPWQAANPRLL